MTDDEQEQKNIAKKLRDLDFDTLSIFYSLADCGREDVTYAFKQYDNYTKSIKKRWVIDLSFLNNLSKIYFDREKTIITFANSVTPRALELWQKVHNAGIACAPIIGVDAKERFIRDNYSGRKLERKRVYSRYTGPTLEIIYQIVPPSFLHLVIRKMRVLNKKLAAININHDDLHPANVTIEFIRKDYLERNLNAQQNINTITYDKNFFSFDPITFLRDPNNWALVVRYIDWEMPREVDR